MNATRYRLLTQLLTQPTAPFREALVVDFVIKVLTRAGVPHFLDPIGNIVVGCADARAYRRKLRAARTPVRLFIAHMDHPGFHGLRWRAPNRLVVRWHGGSPVKHVAGARVWLANGDGYVGAGRLQNVKLHPAGYSIATADVVLARDARAARLADATTLYGGFGFRAPVWRSGKRLYTKAADDLVGVYAVLATALDLNRARRRADIPFLGLLTRAEEVGFVGAIGHFELGWLTPRDNVVCVSLETSRTLPNAVIGRGPVVRLGDRRTVFDHGGVNILSEIARTVLPGRHQRRIMDGGTCEATAAIAYGLRAIGLSVPLGNYHNQGFEGGPDCARPEGPAPEFVHLDDIDGLVTLCGALLRPDLAWDRPWAGQQRIFRQRFRSQRALLR
ncbi:MAG: hypothetical protein ACLGHO_05220 [Gammaproteobacteria bacterium]